eukprot:TRINITY_DN28411_c0_g3_i1.p1 TRINITY_DN28411_c0_g3~~TRINITY_DN28411_c0_g3_i1.p1  ORF type:complete len:1008 (+),score=206.53 TRINITY_DN28411_c0_g3_i1:256-3279(+)
MSARKDRRDRLKARGQDSSFSPRATSGEGVKAVASAAVAVAQAKESAPAETAAAEEARVPAGDGNQAEEPARAEKASADEAGAASGDRNKDRSTADEELSSATAEAKSAQPSEQVPPQADGERPHSNDRSDATQANIEASQAASSSSAPVGPSPASESQAAKKDRRERLKARGASPRAISSQDVKKAQSTDVKADGAVKSEPSERKETPGSEPKTSEGDKSGASQTGQEAAASSQVASEAPASKKDRRERLKARNQDKNKPKAVTSVMSEGLAAAAATKMKSSVHNGIFTVQVKDEKSASQLGLSLISGSGDVQSVKVNSFAYRSGVRTGDVLVSINGKDVHDLLDAEELDQALAAPGQFNFRPGRESRDRDFVVTAGIKSIGCGLTSLPPNPVRIGTVAPGSWAERSGIVPDDEIRLVGDRPIGALDGVELSKAIQARPLHLRIRCAPVNERRYFIREGPTGITFTGSPPRVIDLDKDGWGERSGLKLGDQLLSVGGQDVTAMRGDSRELEESLSHFPAQLQFKLAFAQGAPGKATPNAAALGASTIENIARRAAPTSPGAESIVFRPQPEGRLGTLNLAGGDAKLAVGAQEVDGRIGRPAKAAQGKPLPPAVALKLLPFPQMELARIAPPPRIAEPRLVPQPEWKDRDFYSRKWEVTERIIEEGKIPVQKIQFSYGQICEQRLGPLAFVPEAAMTTQEFQQGLLSSCIDYRLQERGIERSNAKPDYSTMVSPLPYPDLKDKGVVQELGKSLKDNVKIREAMQHDAQLMRHAIPKEAQDKGGKGMTLNAEDKPDLIDLAGKLGPQSFQEITLIVFVASAQNLPAAAFLHACDPYICVSVVDGDPLSPEARCRGDEEAQKLWYSQREQMRQRTGPIKDTLNPVWNTTLRLKVKPRERFFIHFQLLDDEDIRAHDLRIAQAAVPMADVLKYAWAGARNIALIPFDRLVQQKWAELADTRLMVSMNWEGVPNSPPAVAEKMKFEAPTPAAGEGGASKRLAERRERKKQT